MRFDIPTLFSLLLLQSLALALMLPALLGWRDIIWRTWRETAL